MARDAELERLKATQDLAFQRKQDAWQAQDQAWQRRSQAREAMERAYREKQQAYAVMNAAWENLQRVRSYNGPRIDSLNSQQESAFQNMKNAFDRASSAHNARDGASARMYADEGHRHKAEAQGYVAQRRQLVAEIRAAKERHAATKPAFERARDDFTRAKAGHAHAKADHERAQAEFKRAKAEFDRAVAAFKSRLETVRAESKRRKSDKRGLAIQAGVPAQYLDNVWVSRKPDGAVNIYFGGAGSPNGPGHGHYVMDANGTVTYRREPWDPHGGQNFADSQEAALLYTRSARSAHTPIGTNEHGGVFYRRDDSGGTTLHITQYFDDGYHVSWDATPHGNHNVHWTNKNVPDGHPDRFAPPDDAAL